MTTKQPILFLFVLLALMPGCGRGSVGSRPVREQLNTGAIRLTYPELEVIPLTFDTIAEWDVWSAEAPHLFSEVGDVIGGNDSFFLLDGGNHEVVELAVDGTLRNTFGREGSGPGEFRYPLEMALHQDQLWISDVRNVRFSIFNPDGTYVRDVRWPGGSRLVNSFVITSRGGILHGGLWPLTVAELSEQDPLYYLVEFAGEESWEEGSPVHLDTLATMKADPWMGFVIRSEEGDERGWFEAPVFSPRFYWSAGNGMVVTVTAPDYRFEVRDMQGAVQLEVVCPSPDLKVTDAHRRWYFERFASVSLASARPFTLTSDSKARFEFARELQAVAGITVDRAGNIYALVNMPQPGAMRLDIFTADGRYRGSVEGIGLPESFSDDGSILLRDPDPDGLDRFRTGIIH